MNKDNYLRKIIFVGTGEIDNLFNLLPDWNFSEEKYDGLNRKVLTNEEHSVKVIFHNDNGYFQSVNIMPTDGTNKYDWSEKPEENIQEDILYSLWLQINRTIRDNLLDMECGLVPSVYDCKAKPYEAHN